MNKLTEDILHGAYILLKNRCATKDEFDDIMAQFEEDEDLIQCFLISPEIRRKFGYSIYCDRAFIEHIYAWSLLKTKYQDVPHDICYFSRMLTKEKKKRKEVVAQIIDDFLNDPKSCERDEISHRTFHNRLEVSKYVYERFRKIPIYVGEGGEYTFSFHIGLRVDCTRTSVEEAKKHIDRVMRKSLCMTGDYCK
jgi:hypothetical protein